MAKSKDKDIKTNAMRMLEKNKIEFEVNTYECDEFIDGMTVAEHNHQNPDQSYKTLVTEGKSKDINKITGYIRGGCTPLGMKKQYETVVDSSAESWDKIIISGGRIGSQIILNPQDLIKVCKGKFEDIIK